MWYMCQPLAGGKWIPVADFTWERNFTATGKGMPHGNTSWVISGRGPNPGGNQPLDFGSTSQFPEWDAVYSNSSAANNLQLVKR